MVLTTVWLRIHAFRGVTLCHWVSVSDVSKVMVPLSWRSSSCEYFSWLL